MSMPELRAMTRWFRWSDVVRNLLSGSLRPLPRAPETRSLATGRVSCKAPKANPKVLLSDRIAVWLALPHNRFKPHPCRRERPNGSTKIISGVVKKVQRFEMVALDRPQ